MAAGDLVCISRELEVFKALITAQQRGAVRVLSAPPRFHFGQSNHSPEFLCVLPAGKVPAFKGADGFCVLEQSLRLPCEQRGAAGKYSRGSSRWCRGVILFGTNNSSSISGVGAFRGQKLAFPLSPDWQVDYESYTWPKLDPGSEETQTLVQE
ncbi:Elongation factor 1-gamma [Sciurus carolinensis]|uniref:Elongation factor 1-gamma n=1 Tax=Sciurus carolinensis TaxID=30640 RepID=A0AA41NHN6_SCICA|nr:Elongation factor 1-gamma [Sciurus carolinensis]